MDKYRDRQRLKAGPVLAGKARQGQWRTAQPRASRERKNGHVMECPSEIL